MEIKDYVPEFEKSWVYTKALSYLFSPFFDDRSSKKDTFDPEIYSSTIELIAVEDDKVVGLLDIGIYNQEFSLSYKYHPADKVAYFANLAVHPDYQGQGIASKLFAVADKRLIEEGVDVLAIFTREGEVANHLYQKWGGQLVTIDYLVVGNLKSEEPFNFEVLKNQGRLRFSRQGKEIPFYQREGVYILSDKAALEQFDIEQVYKEMTYIKTYKKTGNK